TGELAVGEYVATVTATNSAGSSTATGTVTIQAVVLAPVVTINPLTATAGTVTITGTISNPTATLTLTINGGTHTPEIDGNDWSLQITLSAGEYPTTITAENAGGSDSDSVTVVVEAPVVVEPGVVPCFDPYTVKIRRAAPPCSGETDAKGNEQLSIYNGHPAKDFVRALDSKGNPLPLKGVYRMVIEAENTKT